MAIANDMIMAVGSEENKDGQTEFSIHNVVSGLSSLFH